MAVQIVPTITTDDTQVYTRQLHDWSLFAPRIHIDVTDGVFAPSQTVSLNQLYWDKSANIDLHLMMQQPINWLDQIISLSPDKVILHAESDNASETLPRIYRHLHRFNIKCGLAILPATQVDEVSQLIPLVDEVLIFGGHLGYQGGQADMTQLAKVKLINEIKPEVSVAWDGGANRDNITELVQAGIQVVNVGSAIAKSDNPVESYEELVDLAESAIKNVRI